MSIRSFPSGCLGIPLATVFSLALAATPSIQAQSFVLEFGSGGTVASDGSQFNTTQAENSTFDLSVYLTQTGGETRLSTAMTSLVFADLGVNVISGGALLTPNSFTIGPGFLGLPDSMILGQNVRLDLSEPSLMGLGGPTVADDGVVDNSLLLGTINYTIGAAPTGPFTIEASQSGAPFDFGLAGADPTQIFPQAGRAVVTVTAVPEPSTLALLGVGAVCFGYRQRRTPSRVLDDGVKPNSPPIL